MTSYPSDRQLGILMGRVLLRLSSETKPEDYDPAISVLTQFISERRRQQLVKNPDTAALLFNRACYKNRKAEKVSDQSGQESLKKSAWEDLKLACDPSADPENKEEAQNEPDLASLPNNSDRTWATL